MLIDVTTYTVFLRRIVFIVAFPVRFARKINRKYRDYYIFQFAIKLGNMWFNFLSTDINI